ncbi:MAG: aminomethyl-transferring glycine dehydrogenase [Candidatus Nanopelagicales bacterium]
MTSDSSPFAARHIGPTDAEAANMVRAMGYESVDALIDTVVPAAIRSKELTFLPEALTEPQVLAELAAIAAENQVMVSMLGQGYYDTVTPMVIQRNVLENPAWYTAYTPYQPEISQGRLEALLAFQTMIEDLTALPVAGASLLDEPTAAAEAMSLLRRTHKGSAAVFIVDADIHPQTFAVMETRAEPVGISLVRVDLHGDSRDETAASRLSGALAEHDAFGILLAYPGSSGRITDIEPLITVGHDHGVQVAVVTDLLALTLLRPPGEMGADVVVGSAQRFGVPMGFGGPHAGFMSVRAGLERNMPGRLVGVSVDADGTPAYRLALQTREQHIRREKATSNICTAQVLLAIISAMYAAYHGADGLTAIATRVHGHARDLASRLSAAGIHVEPGAFFDTVRVQVPARAAVAAAAHVGINIRHVSEDLISISVDEVTTEAHIDALCNAVIAGVRATECSSDAGEADRTWPQGVHRTTPFLTHPIFTQHRTETEMMRYLRRLSDRDLALDRTMIPLGSCTMKLNAATEMAAITWPGFARIHPFAPANQTRGYARIIADLQVWLANITGYAAVSLQPNAGAQGEFAGLLAIRAYHQSRGDESRDLCLIPSSAHGTNAASAIMAGFRVQVVACDDDGNVDLDDLRQRIEANAGQLAAVMITYPSTHGVFEASVTTLCDLVHQAGGQVYVDGANLNALVGVAAPGDFGADVSHLNLHKTFCIPHGGGGPGVGPVGVGAHLAPFLPGHPERVDAGPVGLGFNDGGVGPVSGAPWGSAGILPIPWAYLRLMGAHGVTEATKQAIVSANYLAHRLRDYYPILYTGAAGLIAHECIIDIRGITKETGVSVDDIAKRLIDFGFHAPTMSFPVAGTLMIEPTESESVAELDRFVEAMAAIAAEIGDIAAGRMKVEESPLRHAPHTVDCLLDDWQRPYPRRQAAYPLPHLRRDRYWPPVRRIDGAFGDRNLVCSCPAPEAFAEV